MTRTEMLAYVRTYLDEATEAFYKDDEEIYPILTEAQLEVVNVVAKKWLETNRNREMSEVPLVLQPLLTNSTSLLASGADSFTVPTMMFPVSLKWTPSAIAHTTYPTTQQCVWISMSRVTEFLQNPLTKDGFFAWRRGATILLNPKSSITNAVATIEHIATPADITASVDATIHEVGHKALCERALWLLLKDRELQVAMAHDQQAEKLMGELL